MTRRGCLPGTWNRRLPRSGEAGTSLIEILGVLVVIALLGATAVPVFQGQRDAVRTSGAARHLAALVSLTRAESLKRGIHVGLMFQPEGGSFRFAMFADGNHDGVRAVDISSGVDRQVTAWGRIGDHFPGATLGIVSGVPDPESGAPLTGSPVRLAGGSLLSFGPAGGATSGTVYVRGPAEQQFAVRILGTTGRSRVLRYNFGARRWGVA